jgi:hypothetical protein
MNIGDIVITEDGVKGIITEVTDQNRVQDTQEDNPQVWYGVKFFDNSFYGVDELHFNEHQVKLVDE